MTAQSPEIRQKTMARLQAVLRDMCLNEAIELLLNRIIKCDGRLDNPHVVTVFDTSFLMLNRWPDWWDDYLAALENPPLEHKLIVPREVYGELRKHMSDPEKKPLAGVACKKLAQLIERGCEETSLADVQEASCSDIIGADSPIDRKLIGFAESLAALPSTAGVFLATHDGGMMLDVARLRRTGVRVATLTKDDGCEAIKDVLVVWLTLHAPRLLATIRDA